MPGVCIYIYIKGKREDSRHRVCVNNFAPGDVAFRGLRTAKEIKRVAVAVERVASLCH